MKALAARMTRYRNKLEWRSGTLWESRYKSSVVQPDTYLLECSRYIELNPVRARIMPRAEDYPWSSFCLRLLESAENNWLEVAPCFNALGTTDLIRRNRYLEGEGLYLKRISTRLATVRIRRVAVRRLTHRTNNAYSILNKKPLTIADSAVLMTRCDKYIYHIFFTDRLHKSMPNTYIVHKLCSVLVWNRPSPNDKFYFNGRRGV